MKFRNILLAAALVLPLMASALQPASESLASKARTALKQQEWANAQAFYLLLEDKEPHYAPAYAGHMVASEMRGLRGEAIQTLERAIGAGVPLDSVLNPFRSQVRALGEPQFYPELLKEAAQAMPYMSRVFDGRLLDYYAFRRNSAGTIEYANKLLAGLPSDTRFLLMLGQAYMDEGNMAGAVDAWERVLAADPDNFYALVAMGNYLRSQHNPGDKAYFERAYALKPTPYVAAILER